MAPGTPCLPPTAALTYVAEGGANAVYRIRLDEYELARFERGSGDDSFGAGTPPPTELEPWQSQVLEWPFAGTGFVLRIRKNVPLVTSAVDAQSDHDELIAPLFAADQIVSQSLVQIPAAVVQELNRGLKDAEARGTRPRKRHGTYLDGHGYGTVLPDMFFWERESGLTFELKPKWLSQSPSAPPGARRCRTCALRAMRRASSSGAQSGNGFCPLALMSGDADEVEKALGQVTEIQRTSWKSEPWQRLTEAARTSLLLSNLQSAQKRLDSEGVLKTEHANTNLLAAMTIRDCTVYIRVPFEASGQCELRAGDLDLKSPDKLDYWKSIEEKLIGGGWYTSIDSQGCFLERKSAVA